MPRIVATAADRSLQLARDHLQRVQDAWDPPDWANLSLYRFYCLEAAVVAAASHAGIDVRRTHVDKAAAAERLTTDHDLPDISGLLSDLNSARKAAAYGDADLPDLDAEDVVSAIEAYVAAVEELVAK